MADKSRFDHDLFFAHKFPEAPYTYTERESELVRRDHFLLSLNHPLNILRFSRPISHGLCTLGFAVRAIIKCICRGDAHIVKNISGRFLLHVYPGETSRTALDVARRVENHISGKSERQKPGSAVWFCGPPSFNLVAINSFESH